MVKCKWWSRWGGWGEILCRPVCQQSHQDIWGPEKGREGGRRQALVHLSLLPVCPQSSPGKLTDTWPDLTWPDLTWPDLTLVYLFLIQRLKTFFSGRVHYIVGGGWCRGQTPMTTLAFAGDGALQERACQLSPEREVGPNPGLMPSKI